MEFQENLIRVKLFGAVELENQWGHIVENRSRQPLPWLLLKYLLANRHREVSQVELMEKLWPDRPDSPDGNTGRVRLRRLRDLLNPLRLGGTKGLVLFSAGMYAINPEYDILTDADAFSALMLQIRQCPVEDPVGLKLCADAIGLMRSPYMEFTRNASWAEEFRAAYRREFCGLAQDTMNRIITLEHDEVLPLLCRRAAQIAPNEESLHRAIIGYLVARKREIEVVRHVAALSGAGADWLNSET